MRCSFGPLTPNALTRIGSGRAASGRRAVARWWEISRWRRAGIWFDAPHAECAARIGSGWAASGRRAVARWWEVSCGVWVCGMWGFIPGARPQTPLIPAKAGIHREPAQKPSREFDPRHPPLTPLIPAKAGIQLRSLTGAKQREDGPGGCSRAEGVPPAPTPASAHPRQGGDPWPHDGRRPCLIPLTPNALTRIGSGRAASGRRAVARWWGGAL